MKIGTHLACALAALGSLGMAALGATAVATSQLTRWLDLVVLAGAAVVWFVVAAKVGEHWLDQKLEARQRGLYTSEALDRLLASRLAQARAEGAVSAFDVWLSAVERRMAAQTRLRMANEAFLDDVTAMRDGISETPKGRDAA